MATVKEIKISRSWGTKPTDYTIANRAWDVEIKGGDRYDLVQFSINELNKPYYWQTSLCFQLGTPEEEIHIETEKYANSIPADEIKEYLSFLEMGEKYGWD